MSSKPWKARLQQLRRSHKRIAFVGVGHPLHGDDAAGITIIQRLMQVQPDHPDTLYTHGGSAPENITGQVRRFHPDLVVFVDAVQMDTAPGTIQLIDLCDTMNTQASTHALPLTMLAGYFERVTGCAVIVLGIQPHNLDFAAPLSPAVSAACHHIVEFLKDGLEPSQTLSR